jgi:hypothetical protein
MSKGLGRIQRRILDVLRLEAGHVIPTSLLTVYVFMDDKNLAEFRAMDRDVQFLALGSRRVDPWKRNIGSRACNRLWRDGRIQVYDVKGLAWWALPQAEKPKRKKRSR